MLAGCVSRACHNFPTFTQLGDTGLGFETIYSCLTEMISNHAGVIISYCGFKRKKDHNFERASDEAH
jgi:hypothetical protein